MLDWSIIAPIIISGLLLGGIYAVIAQGLNLMWGVLRVINFAHGEFMMLGCYTTFWLITLYKMPFLVTSLVAFLGVGVLGFSIYMVVIKPILGWEELEFNSLLIFFGFGLIMMTIARILWSPTYRIVPVDFGSIEPGGISLSLNYLIPFVISLVVTVLLYLFLRRTYLGKSVRAVVQNKDSATIMGINPYFVYGLTFIIGCGVAAIGGSLISLIYSIFPDMGHGFILMAFCIVCLGGLGSFWGVFIAGLVVGLIESFVGAFAGPQWEPIVVAVLLLIVLPIRSFFAAR